MKKILFITLAFLATNLRAQRLYETCFNSCLAFPFDNEMLAVKIVHSATRNGSLSVMVPGNQDGTYVPHFFLTRIDSTGLELWNKVIAMGANDSLLPCDIVSMPEQGYIVSSYMANAVVLTGVDTAGNITWTRNMAMPAANNLIKLIHEQSDSSLYITGVASDSVFYLIKTDAMGMPTWSKEFSGISTNIKVLDFIMNHNRLYIS